MLTNTAFKNHTQAEELKLTPQEAFERRIGRVGKKSQNPLGIETTLGHFFSVFTEVAAQEGILEQDHNEFLKYMSEKIGVGDSGFGLADTGALKARIFALREGNIVMQYMLDQGLSPESCEKVMKEMYGPQLPYRFELGNIHRYFEC